MKLKNKISTERKWYECPHCRAHLLIYDNTAKCSGVFFKCKKCGQEVEIKIKR